MPATISLGMSAPSSTPEGTMVHKRVVTIKVRSSLLNLQAISPDKLNGKPLAKPCPLVQWWNIDSSAAHKYNFETVTFQIYLKSQIYLFYLMVQCVEFSGNLGAEMEYNIVSSPNCPPRIDKKNHQKSGYCLNDTILMFYLNTLMLNCLY